MIRSSPFYRSGLWFCLVADMSGLLVIPDKPFSAVLMSSHPNPVRGARARGAVAIGAGVAAVFNYQIDTGLQASITEEVLGLGSLAGGALALWGRLKASRKIG